MKAVILAGGRGKRLKPITDYVPKPLIPINNVPILEWQIRYFKKFGIKEFIICAGYKTEIISDFLHAKKNFNVKIHLIKEKVPLGTAGAIKNIKKLISENSFFVINGDIITNIDLKKLRLKQNALAAIPLQTKFGIINIKNNKIIKFSEKINVS
jgi:NDP-sugar pyrophosphorylase family protein